MDGNFKNKAYKRITKQDKSLMAIVLFTGHYHCLTIYDKLFITQHI